MRDFLLLYYLEIYGRKCGICNYLKTLQYCVNYIFLPNAFFFLSVDGCYMIFTLYWQSIYRVNIVYRLCRCYLLSKYFKLPCSKIETLKKSKNNSWKCEGKNWNFFYYTKIVDLTFYGSDLIFFNSTVWARATHSLRKGFKNRGKCDHFPSWPPLNCDQS